jgi:hypothetical protein
LDRRLRSGRSDRQIPMAFKPSKPHSFNDLVVAERARIEKELADTLSGPQRDTLLRKLRQLTIAADLDKWAASLGLQPPK